MFTDLDDAEEFTELTYADTPPFEEGPAGTFAHRVRPLKPERTPRSLTRLERALVHLKEHKVDAVTGCEVGQLAALAETDPSAEIRSGELSGTPASRAAERRAFPRRESGCEVLVHRMPSGAIPDPLRLDWLLHSSRLRGHLLDISMNGAAFLIGERVDQNERMSLRFLDGQRRQKIDTKGTVLRVSPGEAGAWKVVCKLDANLSFEEITRLGRSLSTTRFV